MSSLHELCKIQNTLPSFSCAPPLLPPRSDDNDDDDGDDDDTGCSEYNCLCILLVQMCYINLILQIGKYMCIAYIYIYIIFKAKQQIK